jgi:hypothetical protein
MLDLLFAVTVMAFAIVILALYDIWLRVGQIETDLNELRHDEIAVLQDLRKDLRALHAKQGQSGTASGSSFDAKA